ncbi:MAG: hypothetical protein GX682_06450 [Clostridiaceae bacterium]|nr:hypothetical protein [Clostridiaceae bacterium]
MELLLNNIENNLNNQNKSIKEEDQKGFIETNIGKTINFGLDIGLRALLPNFIEEQIIDIKDTILKEGFSEGIKKVISSAMDFGKSTLGIFTGNFENISQVQTAVKNGGIIDGASQLIDTVLNKTVKKGVIPYGIANTIKRGKNVILNSVTNKIEEEFNNQLDAAEKLQKYSNNWKQYYEKQDFSGMEREYEKIKEKLKILIPIETTINEAKKIENMHTLIKNNGKQFNLTEEEIKLANLLN